MNAPTAWFWINSSKAYTSVTFACGLISMNSIFYQDSTQLKGVQKMIFQLILKISLFAGPQINLAVNCYSCFVHLLTGCDAAITSLTHTGLWGRLLPTEHEGISLHVQGSAKELFLGCVNLASGLSLAAERDIMQPRNHSLANHCIPFHLCKKHLSLGFHSDQQESKREEESNLGQYLYDIHLNFRLMDPTPFIHI